MGRWKFVRALDEWSLIYETPPRSKDRTVRSDFWHEDMSKSLRAYTSPKFYSPYRNKGRQSEWRGRTIDRKLLVLSVYAQWKFADTVCRKSIAKCCPLFRKSWSLNSVAMTVFRPEAVLRYFGACAPKIEIAVKHRKENVYTAIWELSPVVGNQGRHAERILGLDFWPEASKYPFLRMRCVNVPQCRHISTT